MSKIQRVEMVTRFLHERLKELNPPMLARFKHDLRQDWERACTEKARELPEGSVLIKRVFLEEEIVAGRTQADGDYDPWVNVRYTEFRIEHWYKVPDSYDPNIKIVEAGIQQPPFPEKTDPEPPPQTLSRLTSL